ncbi:hypothetical protein MXD81_33515 [Microbacteriaceae bacterium K1510]|nr:hypothetical protein [Microbacteriaceae bacterium K1510]
MHEVQYISCTDAGPFLLWFRVGEKSGWATAGTNVFGMNDERLVDLSKETLHDGTGNKKEFKDGMEIWPEFYITAGKSIYGDHLIYNKNGQVAFFEVSGTSLNPSVKITSYGAIGYPPRPHDPSTPGPRI